LSFPQGICVCRCRCLFSLLLNPRLVSPMLQRRASSASCTASRVQPLKYAFPFWEPPKINLKKWRVFRRRKRTTNPPRFTTNPPRFHHQNTIAKHALFPKPPQKSLQISNSHHPTSPKYFLQNYRKASCVGTGSASIFSTSSVTSRSSASCAGGFAGPANPA
jgi:hypothetical protein